MFFAKKHLPKKISAQFFLLLSNIFFVIKLFFCQQKLFAQHFFAKTIFWPTMDGWGRPPLGTFPKQKCSFNMDFFHKGGVPKQSKSFGALFMHQQF